jgi:hypothetical protein
MHLARRSVEKERYQKFVASGVAPLRASSARGGRARIYSSDGTEVRFLKPGRFGHREDASGFAVAHTRGGLRRLCKGT